MKNTGKKWRGEEKKNSHRRHEENLKTYGLAFDAENFFRGAFENFSQIFRHGSGNPVANQDDYHGSEGYNEAIASVIGWAEDTTDR